MRLPSVPLSRQPDVMEAICAAVTGRGESMESACKRAGVSRNSYWAWRKVLREPSVTKLSALGSAAGFEMRMVGHGRNVDLADLGGVMSTLDAHRRRARISIHALDEQSGVPNRSYSAWLAGARVPALLALSTLAGSLGYRLIMEPRPDPGDRRVLALAPAVEDLSERLAALSDCATRIMAAGR